MLKMSAFCIYTRPHAFLESVIDLQISSCDNSSQIFVSADFNSTFKLCLQTRFIFTTE